MDRQTVILFFVLVNFYALVMAEAMLQYIQGDTAGLLQTLSVTKWVAGSAAALTILYIYGSIFWNFFPKERVLRR